MILNQYRSTADQLGDGHRLNSNSWRQNVSSFG